MCVREGERKKGVCFDFKKEDNQTSPVPISFNPPTYYLFLIEAYYPEHLAHKYCHILFYIKTVKGE